MVRMVAFCSHPGSGNTDGSLDDIADEYTRALTPPAVARVTPQERLDRTCSTREGDDPTLAAEPSFGANVGSIGVLIPQRQREENVDITPMKADMAANRALQEQAPDQIGRPHPG
jgi:hypothetical protein